MTSNIPQFPVGEKFDVILADPPWRYDFSRVKKWGIEEQYPTMSLEDICAINVPSAKDSILLLWATSPKLEEAFKVLENWGFNYKTCMVWDKIRIGMGYYWMQQHEILLLASKGHPEIPISGNRPSSVLRAKFAGHSRKPDEIYTMIKRMFPGKSYLEMFARTKANGFETYSLDVEENEKETKEIMEMF